MITYNPLLCLDFYKTCHAEQYPKGLTKMVSYYTPRMSRLGDTGKVTLFGLQAFIREYLVEAFNEHFFNAKDWVKVLICIVVSIVSIALIILTMIMPIVWSIKLHNPAFLLLWCIPAGIFVGVWAYQEFFDF